jgi:hypothetical protein
MAWENLMALGMTLAEKVGGGVSVLVGVKCCTFIPNNTALGGTITKVLQHLTALSENWLKTQG